MKQEPECLVTLVLVLGHIVGKKGHIRDERGPIAGDVTLLLGDCETFPNNVKTCTKALCDSKRLDGPNEV